MLAYRYLIFIRKEYYLKKWNTHIKYNYIHIPYIFGFIFVTDTYIKKHGNISKYRIASKRYYRLPITGVDTTS